MLLSFHTKYAWFDHLPVRIVFCPSFNLRIRLKNRDLPTNGLLRGPSPYTRPRTYLSAQPHAAPIQGFDNRRDPRRSGDANAILSKVTSASHLANTIRDGSMCVTIRFKPKSIVSCDVRTSQMPNSSDVMNTFDLHHYYIIFSWCWLLMRAVLSYFIHSMSNDTICSDTFSISARRCVRRHERGTARISAQCKYRVAVFLLLVHFVPSRAQREENFRIIDKIVVHHTNRSKSDHARFPAPRICKTCSIVVCSLSV